MWNFYFLVVLYIVVTWYFYYRYNVLRIKLKYSVRKTSFQINSPGFFKGRH